MCQYDRCKEIIERVLIDLGSLAIASIYLTTLSYG